jgi:hypothetical protein
MPHRSTGITGRGFDIIIIDDPISAHHIKSERERANVNENCDTMVASRLDDQIGGVIMVVGQRMHEDDLSGNLLQRDGWKHICLPLVAEEEASYPVGKLSWHLKNGEPLLSGQWPEQIIKRKREEVGEPIFAAQYQQNPSAAFGELNPPPTRFCTSWTCRRTPSGLGQAKTQRLKPALTTVIRCAR